MPPLEALPLWTDQTQYDLFYVNPNGAMIRCNATQVIIGQNDGYLSATPGTSGIASVDHISEANPKPWPGYHPKLGNISVFTKPQDGKGEEDYPIITLWNIAGEKRHYEPDHYGPASNPN